MELSDGDRPVNTEDGGVTHERCIVMSSKINIESDMYNKILNYMIYNDYTKIKITKDYIRFQNSNLYTWGYELNDLVYVFNNKSALDNYQYDNAVYDIVKVADRWYYGTSNAYGLAY